jgi:hypothetical protein
VLLTTEEFVEDASAYTRIIRYRAIRGQAMSVLVRP